MVLLIEVVAGGTCLPYFSAKALSLRYRAGTLHSSQRRTVGLLTFKGGSCCKVRGEGTVRVEGRSEAGCWGKVGR